MFEIVPDEALGDADLLLGEMRAEEREQFRPAVHRGLLVLARAGTYDAAESMHTRH